MNSEQSHTHPFFGQQEPQINQQSVKNKKSDQRVLVDEELLKTYPYSGICQLGYKKKDQVRQHGTGFLISPTLVLTCAHNVYSYQKKTQEQIKLNQIFVTFSDKTTIVTVKKENIKYKEKQFPILWKQGGFKEQFYEYALLILQQQASPIFQPLNLNFKFQINQNDRKIHLGIVSGYPTYIYSSEGLLTDAENKMYQDINKFQISKKQGIFSQKLKKTLPTRQFIQHYIDSTGGNSGSPFLHYGNKGQITVIGIHYRGFEQNRNINKAIMLDSQILQDIKKWSKDSFEEKKVQPNFNTKMTFLPKILKLQELSSNGISKFQINAEQSNLKFLLLDKNQIQQIPTCVWSMQYLIHLDLSSNRIKGEIVKEIDQLSKLTLLNLKDNNISKFQIKAEQSNLKFLLLGNNQIQQIPTCVWSMQYLIELDLSNNQLPSGLKLYDGIWEDSQGKGFLLPRQINIINISGNQKVQKLELSKAASWKYLKQLNAEKCSIRELQLSLCLFEPQGVIIKLKGNQLNSEIKKNINKSVNSMFFQIGE